MRMLGVRRAAVVDGTKVVGMITFTDIFRRAVEKVIAP
jgi:CBS domain-containing protein